MATTKNGFIINDFGLSANIRKRIDDLVTLQITPSTINLFTAEFSQMDDDIKKRIGMYIANILEAENAMWELHFQKLRENNVAGNGNAKEHLIMEQRKTNLLRIQQIFAPQTRTERQFGNTMPEHNDQTNLEFGRLNFKDAMTTNNDGLTVEQRKRLQLEKIANLRRLKELEDFEISQIQKLIKKAMFDGDDERVAELETQIARKHQEFNIRKQLITQDVTGNVPVSTNAVASKKYGASRQTHKEKNIFEGIDSTADFFAVDDSKLQKATHTSTPKSLSHRRNKKSDILEDFLSDETIDEMAISLSKDFSNPNQAQAEADQILASMPTIEQTLEQGQKDIEDDPFLMLLVNEQALKEKSSADQVPTKKKSSKAKIPTRAKKVIASKPVSKPVETDNKKITSLETKIEKLENRLEQINEKYNNEKELRRQLVQDMKSKSMEDELKRSEKEISKYEAQLTAQKDALAAATKEKQQLLDKMNAIEQQMQRIAASQSQIHEVTPIIQEKIVEKEVLVPDTTREHELLAKIAQLEQEKNDLAVKAATPEVVEKIIEKVIEKPVYVQTPKSKAQVAAESTNMTMTTYRHKADSLLTQLNQLYIERLKGVNVINTLKNLRDAFDEASTRIKIQNVRQELFLKEEAHLAKKNLANKERIHELKHTILVNEDKNGIERDKVSGVPEVENLIHESLDNVATEVINWEEDDKDLVPVPMLDVTEEIYTPPVIAAKKETDNNLPDAELVFNEALYEDNRQAELRTQKLQAKEKMHTITKAERAELASLKARHQRDSKQKLSRYRLLKKTYQKS